MGFREILAWERRFRELEHRLESVEDGVAEQSEAHNTLRASFNRHRTHGATEARTGKSKEEKMLEEILGGEVVSVKEK